MKHYNIAVVGATGLVGEMLLTLLAERKFPVDKLYALGNQYAAGKEVEFGRKEILITDIKQFDFAQVELAFFTAGAAISAEYAPKAAAAGCIVIDNTTQFRDEHDVPLIIPEVNLPALAGFSQRNIVANPNCTTIQMLVALKPLHDAATITRINVTTYQAVSGTGRKGIDELAGQTARLLNGKPIKVGVYPKQIAFNVVPQIGVFQDNGYTEEEMEMIREVRKILDEPEIMINPTAVRVPVFFGYSEAIHIETERKLTAKMAKAILMEAPGVMMMDEGAGSAYPTAVTDAANNDAVLVGRIREDISHPTGLNLWVVVDNVRKGAALNCVQISESLVNDYL